MAQLNELLEGIGVISLHGDGRREISALSLDSRSVGRGGLFFAVRGVRADGHDYIEGAIADGAAAIVCEKMQPQPKEGVAYVVVKSSEKAIGPVASAFYGNPSAKLKLVGVTGTNGKTTTATLLYDMFRSLGYKAGLLSTVEYRIDDRTIEATHTTPDAIRLNRMMAEMADAGCDYCFMEVSSHSVVQHRIEGLTFAGGIFTNITHDHLDYHKTFAEYIKAKKAFFDKLPAEAFALVNIDDRNGRVMVQNTRARVKGYSMRSMADFTCRIIEAHVDGMLLGFDTDQVWVRFLGRFNAYNLLSVYAASTLLGAGRGELLRGMSLLSPVKGRFEYLRSPGGVTAIVDYAHTPDALKNVLETVNEIKRDEQKLYVVVGCGGDRDAAKRPVMAHIAASQSDLAILTSDNPRSERPEDILAQMKEGVRKGDRYIVVPDRREAIRSAATLAAEGDIILVAGKGHENYQEAAGVRIHFDDRQEVAQALGIVEGA